jgi:hypothetical protein
VQEPGLPQPSCRAAGTAGLTGYCSCVPQLLQLHLVMQPDIKAWLRPRRCEHCSIHNTTTSHLPDSPADGATGATHGTLDQHHRLVQAVPHVMTMFTKRSGSWHVLGATTKAVPVGHTRATELIG